METTDGVRPAGGKLSCVAIDAALLVALVGTIFHDQVVVWFHLVFLVVTVAAFRCDVRPFLLRALPSLTIVTIVLVRDWRAGIVPFDEVLELPILSAVPALINVVAVRRTRLEREVVASGRTLRRLQRTREAELQDRELFDLSVESTGWLTASAMHDLNNILATILVNSEVIAERHPDDADGTAQIEHAVDAARRLVSGMAELIGSDSLDAWCDLHEVIEDTLELHVPTGVDSVRVETDFTADAGRVHLPRVLAYQLVSNVIVNAFAAMPSGGRLLIRTAPGESASTVLLTIADSGQGMTEAVQRRAFDPDFTTRPIGGSGLGLYTVGRIVEASGGSIELITGPGEGTAFTFVLPSGEPPPERADRPSGPDVPHIMVVEDESLLRERWVTLIEARGHHVTAASDAESALRSVHQHGLAPDVLVTDYSMPGMDGIELIDALRRESPDVPVILVSGFVRRLPDGWLEHPGNVFVPKPCSSAALITAIDDALDARRHARAG